jgi:cytochrome oxidase assembly protein ShyY1
VYRFLATPRWLGLAALMAAAAAVMVGLGLWQLDRYHERTAINERITAAASTAPAPVASVLPVPRVGGGPALAPGVAWTRVAATGVYDPAQEILARGRTVEGRVGFEVLTPLRLADGSALLVDRGWVPPGPGGASAHPDVPPAPGGQVTVVGRVHLNESRAATVETVDGMRQVRRIGVGEIGRSLPYPVYGAYVVLDQQTPPVDARFSPIPVTLERSWQNAGYVVQWWMFAAFTLFGFVWLARREAHHNDRFDRDVRGLADVHLPEAPVSPAL